MPKPRSSGHAIGQRFASKACIGARRVVETREIVDGLLLKVAQFIAGHACGK